MRRWRKWDKPRLRAARGFVIMPRALYEHLTLQNARKSHDPDCPDHTGRDDHSPQVARRADQSGRGHARADARVADRAWHARKAGEDAREPDLAVDLPVGRARFSCDDQS